MSFINNKRVVDGKINGVGYFFKFRGKTSDTSTVGKELKF
jgi:hypothetical protein